MAITDLRGFLSWLNGSEHPGPPVQASLPAASLDGAALRVKEQSPLDLSNVATHAKQDTQTDEAKLHRTLIRKTLAVAGVVDGGEVEVAGLTASAPYELRCMRSTLATTGGAATHRQRSLYEDTGGAAVDLAYQEAAALAIADGISIPLRPGPIMVTDAAGKLWLRYAVTGAGDITETVMLDFLPMIAG
jgi:hypothetical protein